MANMVDYLNWRGDLDFIQSPYNEVDSLILSHLAYVRLDGYVPWLGENRSISLGELADAYWEHQDEQALLQEFSLIKMAPFLLRRVGRTRRFGKLRAHCYQHLLKRKEYSQFAAMVISLNQHQHVVSFRGTDNTMIGWRESFAMSFGVIPAQKEAVAYLEEIAQQVQGTLYLGGHSKGGNLAVYSGCKCSKEVQERIQRIDNHDGPGFCKERISPDEYARMKGKINKYVPDESIVGMLLKGEEECIVVSSTEQGIRQHDPTTWRVLGTEFVRLPCRSYRGELLDQTLGQWVEHMSAREKEEVIQTTFKLLEKEHIETVHDLVHITPGQFYRIRRQLGNNPTCNRWFRRLLKICGKGILKKKN